MTMNQYIPFDLIEVKVPPVKSCNRHFDCKEAEEVFYSKHPKEPRGYIPNFHCNDDECEDCFGC